MTREPAATIPRAVKVVCANTKGPSYHWRQPIDTLAVREPGSLVFRCVSCGERVKVAW